MRAEQNRIAQRFYFWWSQRIAILEPVEIALNILDVSRQIINMFKWELAPVLHFDCLSESNCKHSGKHQNESNFDEFGERGDGAVGKAIGERR